MENENAVKKKSITKRSTVLWGLLLIIIAIVFYFMFLIFKDILFAPKYYNEIVAGTTLEKEEIAYLKEKRFYKEGESLLYFFAFNGLEAGGLLLTDSKVLYYEGDLVEKASFDTIKDMKVYYSDSMMMLSAITVYRNDNTEFSFDVPHVYAQDRKFFSKLKSLWTTSKKGLIPD